MCQIHAMKILLNRAKNPLAPTIDDFTKSPGNRYLHCSVDHAEFNYELPTALCICALKNEGLRESSHDAWRRSSMGVSRSAIKRANITSSGTHRSKLIERNVTRGDFLLRRINNPLVTLWPLLNRGRQNRVEKSLNSSLTFPDSH